MIYEWAFFYCCRTFYRLINNHLCGDKNTAVKSCTGAHNTVLIITIV